MAIALKGLTVPGVLALIAVACGGAGAPSETPAASGAVDTGSTPATATAAPPTAAAAPSPTLAPAATDAIEATPGAEQPGGESAPGESFARVTIGDQTYEFAPEPGNGLERCDSNFFGGFWVLFASGIEMTLPGENWEAQGIVDPAAIRVTTSDGTEWTAHPDTYGTQPGESQVDSYSINGDSASGTATFVDTTNFGAEMTPVSGSFEATCAADFGN